MLASDEKILQHKIGPGDDVFMVGRFIDAGGIEVNQPAVRFGNISLMPVPVPHENGANVPSYALDMHSRTGFSGSPVFVYRKPGQDLGSGDLNMSDQFLFLLGIHWGQFPERWEIVSDPKKAAENAGEISLAADANYIKGMSGMTCVAPSEAIVELLQHPKLRAHQERVEAEVWARKNSLSTSPKLEPSPSFSGGGFGSFSGPKGSRQKRPLASPLNLSSVPGSVSLSAPLALPSGDGGEAMIGQILVGEPLASDRA